MKQQSKPDKWALIFFIMCAAYTLYALQRIYT